MSILMVSQRYCKAQTSQFMKRCLKYKVLFLLTLGESTFFSSLHVALRC